jgi:hypothetical protein
METAKVFISSILNPKIEDLRAERETIRSVVESYRFLLPWAFEKAPASHEELDESYLRHVSECDLFIQIVGSAATNPVAAELQMAKDTQKPLLIFSKKTETRSPLAQALLDSAGVKYASFATIDELRQAAIEAIEQILVSGLRALSTIRLRAAERGSLVVTVEPRSNYILSPISSTPGSAVKGLFAVLDLVIEKKGAKPSVIREFRLRVDGLQDCSTLMHSSTIQGRNCAYAIDARDDLAPKELLNLPGGGACRGRLVFYHAAVPGNANFVEDPGSHRFPTIPCRLTVKDTDGIEGSAEFELREAG